MNIPKNGSFEGIALIVDINHFTNMVTKAKYDNSSIAQFVRDVLSGAISAIEEQNGEVVAYMGDAVLGILPTAKNAIRACWDMAKDLDRQCEYISNAQEEDSQNWGFMPGGPSLKIALEFGEIDVSTITSRFFGEQRLLIGEAINYAARISQPGDGNRCHIGPLVARMKPFTDFDLEGPLTVEGKSGEPPYAYYKFDLGEIWKEEGQPGGDTYWG